MFGPLPFAFFSPLTITLNSEYYNPHFPVERTQMYEVQIFFNRKDEKKIQSQSCELLGHISLPFLGWRS